MASVICRNVSEKMVSNRATHVVCWIEVIQDLGMQSFCPKTFLRLSSKNCLVYSDFQMSDTGYLVENGIEYIS
jgi:hypothetical protein